MNLNNYGTLEACKRLDDAGIVLETDCIYGCIYCINGNEQWEIQSKNDSHFIQSFPTYPAPSMVEVWRELPFQSYIKQMGGLSLAWICDDEDETETLESGFIQSTNPTDALIDLLIWARKEGRG
jgi:hypothetical protein